MKGEGLSIGKTEKLAKGTHEGEADNREGARSSLKGNVCALTLRGRSTKGLKSETRQGELSFKPSESTA